MSAGAKATPGRLQLVWGDVPSWAYPATAALLEALRKVDPGTYFHCLRVGEYSRLLAKSAGLGEYQQRVAEFSGLLHDIGKIGISTNITNKPGKLDDQEARLMRNHAEFSEQIVASFDEHSFFQQVLPAVRGHHERVDGQGYPDSLAGDEIPLISRVILIVDTLDAMSADRAYRKGLPLDRVYQEIKKYSGTQFDPSLAKTFLESHASWQTEEPDENSWSQVTGQKILRAA